MTNTHNDDDDSVITKEDAETAPYDPAEFMSSRGFMQEYLNISLEEDVNTKMFLSSLNTLIRAWALSQLARKTKIKRENLCEILLGESELTFEALTKIVEALGLKMPAEFYERFGLQPEKTVKTSIPYTHHKQTDQPHASL
ncbi:MAG: hypothetical protein IIT54_02520 [Acetobacter sp.]|nr:hypothetical protein [Acetobacter sp.]